MNDILGPDLKYVRFELGEGEHAGLIRMVPTMTRDHSAFTLATSKTGKHKRRINCSAMVRKLGLDKKFVEFRREGDLFIGQLKSPKTALVAPEGTLTQKEVQVIRKAPPGSAVVVDRDNPVPAKEKFLIRFDVQHDCRLSRKFCEIAANRPHIRVEKLLAQKKMKVTFPLEKDDTSFYLRRYTNGIHFQAKEFVRKYGLDGKKVDFSFNQTDHAYYGEIF